jgi:hypothetical protein
MNGFTNFEVLELLAVYESSIVIQLQLWLTMTFSAITASFLARDHLTKRFAHFMTSIYLLATTAIAGRWMVELYRINILLEAYEVTAQTFPSWGTFLALSTFLMFALGTGGCVFCIYHFRRDRP